MGKFLMENSVTENGKNKGGSVHNNDMKLSSSDELQIDSYFGPELPSNILFPDQLNKYLREQIQNLSLENGSLRRSLEEMQDELSSVKQKHSKPTLPISGRASEIAANKIAELSKKLREQNAELESLRTRTKDAEAKLRHLEANTNVQECPTPPSEDKLAEKDRQIKSLTEKLQASNSKMCDFRNQCQALRQEMKLAQKVIESEVGEKVSWQDLAKENGGWRGRAQHIITLQNKIQHLQDQLSNNSTNTATETPAANVLRQIEKDRRATYEETTKQLNQKTIQLEEMRKKLEASKARNKVLENEIVQVKTKLSSLMEKGVRDEQLVASLTNQINSFEDRGKAQIQCFTKMQDNISNLQQEIDIEKEKNEQLQKALGLRENRIQQLEEQIEEFRKIRSINIEESTNRQKENDVKPEAFNEDPNRKAFSIVDSERMRLLELLAVVNRRLDDSRREQRAAETQLRKEKFKNAKLETKVARLELERVGAIKTGRGSYSQNKPGESSLDEADIMARQQIEYLEEECLALKTRIETLQMEKESDLKVFTAMASLRENLLENKHSDRKTANKVNSTCKLPKRKTKHNQNKMRKYSQMGYSAICHSSFSSEESVTQ